MDSHKKRLKNNMGTGEEHFYIKTKAWCKPKPPEWKTFK